MGGAVCVDLTVWCGVGIVFVVAPSGCKPLILFGFVIVAWLLPPLFDGCGFLWLFWGVWVLFVNSIVCLFLCLFFVFEFVFIVGIGWPRFGGWFFSGYVFVRRV